MIKADRYVYWSSEDQTWTRVSMSGSSHLVCSMTKIKGFHHPVRRRRLIKMIKSEIELGGLKNKLGLLSTSGHFFSWL